MNNFKYRVKGIISNINQKNSNLKYNSDCSEYIIGLDFDVSCYVEFEVQKSTGKAEKEKYGVGQYITTENDSPKPEDHKVLEDNKFYIDNKFFRIAETALVYRRKVRLDFIINESENKKKVVEIKVM